MTCEHARPLLTPYVDRELDVAKTLEVETHLRECPACEGIVRSDEALRSSLRAAALVFTPPRALEARVRRAVRREVRPRLTLVDGLRRWAAVPLAATLAAALSWSVATHRGAAPGDQQMLAELVSGHVRSLMVDHLVDVATSDQHTVKPWFNGKVDFAPPVKDLTADGFPLIGGRADYIAGRPVAVLVYKRRQHVVNVFISPSDAEGDEPLRPRTFQGYQLLRWSASGLTFWAVSDVSSADLEALAHLLQGTR